MEQYVVICICTTILSLSGCLDFILLPAGLERRDMAYPALGAALLSGLAIRPVAEFDVAVSALALPAAFFLISVDASGQRQSLLGAMAGLSMIPVGVVAAATVAEVALAGYSAFILEGRLVCIAQLGLSLTAAAVGALRKHIYR